MIAVCGQNDEPISWEAVVEALQRFVDSLDRDIQRILLVPPDYTRKHSGAGRDCGTVVQHAGRQAD